MAAFIQDVLNPARLDKVTALLKDCRVFRLLTSISIPLWPFPELAVTSIMCVFLRWSQHRH